MYGLHTEIVRPQWFECAMQGLVTINLKAEVWAAARFFTCSQFGPSNLCLHTLKLRLISYPLVVFSLSLLHMRIILLSFLS